MSQVESIMIVGVGGQGTLLASRVLGNAAQKSGEDVKVCEVHGMSQRGGSVVTYVRYGDEVFSPVIDEGGADIVLSFELLEAARWLPWLKMGGRMITNTRQIDPMPVIIGAAAYPERLTEKIREAGASLLSLDALTLAGEAGSSKVLNIVLIGVLSMLLPFSEETWQEALKECVPPKFLEINRRAFALGRQAVPTGEFSNERERVGK